MGTNWTTNCRNLAKAQQQTAVEETGSNPQNTDEEEEGVGHEWKERGCLDGRNGSEVVAVY